MTQLMWIRSHVEQLLEAEWDACRVQADTDGDYPFRRETAAGWVSVLESDPVMVRVFAHAAFGIKPTAAVLRELNEIQRRLLSCRVEIVEGTVVVAQTINPVGMTQEVLAQALNAVSSVAADIGPLLVALFGGSTPYPLDEVAAQDAE
jgi:hypothetical protein